MKKRVFSGTRATGRLHLGNYFGAVKGYIELSESGEYECIFMAVDLHTITTPYESRELCESTRNIIIDYLSCGLDPKKAVVTVQSMVPEHAYLAFLFSSVISVARMRHLPTFKEKVKQYPEGVTMALLNYPVLMAADILSYNAQLVPVGVDQEPHLEVAREIAKKMNGIYGTNFCQPKRFKTKGEYIPSLTGEGKMSKSVAGSYINLTDSGEQIRKKIRKVPTATVVSGEPEGGVKALFDILKVLDGAEFERFIKRYKEDGEFRFVELKDRVSEVIDKELKPIREKRVELEGDRKYVDRVIEEGVEKAREIAGGIVKDTKKKMGFL